MKRIKAWWISTFCVISVEKAKQLNLTFFRNVYGDEVNKINCRSEWRDASGRFYRVKSLYLKQTGVEL